MKIAAAILAAVGVWMAGSFLFGGYVFSSMGPSRPVVKTQDSSLPIPAGTVIKNFTNVMSFAHPTRLNGGPVNSTLQYAGFLFSFKKGDSLTGSFRETNATWIGILYVDQNVQGFGANQRLSFVSDNISYQISTLITKYSFDYAANGTPLTFELYFGMWLSNTSLRVNDTITVVGTIQVISNASAQSLPQTCSIVPSMSGRIDMSFGTAVSVSSVSLVLMFFPLPGQSGTVTFTQALVLEDV